MRLCYITGFKMQWKNCGIRLQEIVKDVQIKKKWRIGGA